MDGLVISSICHIFLYGRTPVNSPSLRVLFIGIFLFSAVVKTMDFEKTTLLLSSITKFKIAETRILLSTLILLELCIAGFSFFKADRKKYVYWMIMGILNFFLGFSVVMWIWGESNCGCMGTVFVTTPLVSIIKNLILIILLYLMRMNIIRKQREFYRYD